MLHLELESASSDIIALILLLHAFLFLILEVCRVKGYAHSNFGKPFHYFGIAINIFGIFAILLYFLNN